MGASGQGKWVCRACGDGTAIYRRETVNASWRIDQIRQEGASLGYRTGPIETETYYKYEPEYECDNCGESDGSIDDLLVTRAAFEAAEAA